MKRTSAHITRSPPPAPAVVEPSRRATATAVPSDGPSAVEQLRFRERDGKPSAYTRLYAQGVDLLVHKDQVYQQFGLRKSPQPSTRQSKSPGATPGSHITRGNSMTTASASTVEATNRLRASSGSSRHLTARGSGVGASNTTASRMMSPRSSSMRSKQTTGSMGTKQYQSTSNKRAATASAMTERPSAKPQRRQSTIATQLLNKSLKIGPAIIHAASSAAILSQSTNSTSAATSRSPRLSMTAGSSSTYQRRPSASPTATTQQQHRQSQLLRRQSFQISTNCPPAGAAAPQSRSVGKPAASSPAKPSLDSQQPPVLVPVSRRTSSPLVAPNGADFGGMRRRPSVSPIRGATGGGGTGGSSYYGDESSNAASQGGANAPRLSMLVRRDSKMDRLVEQITVLKNSLGLSDEDLQWKVESTKGNAYQAADRHLCEAEELYDRLVYEIQMLSDTPCDEASAALVKRMRELVSQTNLISELKPTLSNCQADIIRGKKELLDARIACELKHAKAGTTAADTDGAPDEGMALAQKAIDDTKQRLLQTQNLLTAEMTKLNELLVVLGTETDALAATCSRFKFLSTDAADVSTTFLNILRCIPECSGEKLVTLCEQGIQTAQRFTGSKAKEIKRKEGDLAKTLRDIEVWKTRKEQSKEFALEMQKQERLWKESQRDANAASLRVLRGLIPQEIQQITVDALIERARSEGVLYTYDLALYIKQNKLLHWLVTHESDIARDNFLAVECASWFLNFTNYDIHELRAACGVLPESFDFDKDGKKAEWKRQFMEHVRMLVKQQQGETIKAGWDPLKGTRAEVPLKPLSDKQLLNAVYRYPTEEEIKTRIDRFELQLKRLAQKKEKKEKLETHDIPTAKAEYLAIAEDARSEELQQAFGKATLIKMRDDAKQAFQSLSKSRDMLKAEIEHSERQWSAQTPSYEQFLEEVAKIRALDPEVRSGRIKGPFPAEFELKPRERAAFKKLSVEEEAEARRLELSRAIADRDKGLADGVIATAAAAAEEVAATAAANAAATAAAVAEAATNSSAEPSPRDPSTESEAQPPSTLCEGANAGSADKAATSLQAEVAAVAATESGSFRRIKSLRVSVDVLKFLQNDFCSPRRTKSNLTLPASETGSASASGMSRSTISSTRTSRSESDPVIRQRRPSFPKPSGDEPETEESKAISAAAAAAAAKRASANAEPARPKSKALLAILERQKQTQESTTETVEGSAPAKLPAMGLNFLSELKKKANKVSDGDNSSSSEAPSARPAMAALGFLGELKSRTKSNEASETAPVATTVTPPATEDSPKKGSFLDELKRVAAKKDVSDRSGASDEDGAALPPQPVSTRPAAASPPAAPRSFLDELKAKALSKSSSE